MTPPTTDRAMIIAERGAPWAPWAERFRALGPDVVVVLQHVGEPIADLAARVRARLVELEAAGQAPQRAVLVGGGRVDRDALSARSLTLRAVASSMARTGGGSVVLDDAGADRYSMAALAATVSMLVRGTGVTVDHAAMPGTPRPLAA